MTHPSKRNRAFRHGTILMFALALFGVPSIGAACPTAEIVLARLEQANPGHGSRTTDFGQPPPRDLYLEAAQSPGEPAVSRDGKMLFGALLVELPIEALWKAINDEDHHDLQDDYMPVRYSEVIEGTPRGEDRVLFQYFKQSGIGRWWVSDVEINTELFTRSNGELWELRWNDRTESVDATAAPMNLVSEKMVPLRESYGAWLLIPINDRCTFIDYYTMSDPGGFAGFAQGFVAKRAIRSTLHGLVNMASEHVTEPHPDAVFVGADGTPLD